jgi:phosphohistidine phosphatase
MQLYLLRHADAEREAASDFERSLSGKGISQSEKVAQFLKRNDITIDLFLTSPFPRARQTAELAAAEFNGVEANAADFLRSGMRPATAIDELKDYARFKSIMLVGHEPDFSMLAAELLGLPGAENIKLRKASLTLLELETIRPGAATLQFSVPVKMM